MREGMVRIPSGCAISAVMHVKGVRFNGEAIITSISRMHERSNGLGGGFAAYGIYPEFQELYALHLLFESDRGRSDAESFIQKHFVVEHSEPIPTRPMVSIINPPEFRRYFVRVRPGLPDELHGQDETDYLAWATGTVNSSIEDAWVLSAGRNMGVFKGVGYPEDIGRYFRLEEYEGYLWTAHGRFPTNTPGWWGGAHPFGILDWTVVHNGEVSSYGINKRYLEMFGYHLNLQTDTEVVAYLFDLLHRRQGVPLPLVAKALAPPFWKDIDRMPERDRALHQAIRMVYGPAMLNGPFSIIVAFSGGMLGLNDRIKLRPLICGRSGEYVLMGSEESAIRGIVGDLEEIWEVRAGEMALVELDQGGVAVG